MAQNQQSIITDKWVKFEEEFTDDDLLNDKKQFNQFIESRKDPIQAKYEELAKLDEDKGYKGWSMNILGILFFFVKKILNKMYNLSITYTFMYTQRMEH